MAVEPIDFDGVETLSFRQIDAMNGFNKGTTFRLFKRLRAARPIWFSSRVAGTSGCSA